jgi:hypothetical protein
MTSEECHQRAANCAASADMSLDGAVALEFMTLAAQWRAMAVRQMFLGHVEMVGCPTEKASGSPYPC